MFQNLLTYSEPSKQKQWVALLHNTQVVKVDDTIQTIVDYNQDQGTEGYGMYGTPGCQNAFERVPGNRGTP